MIGNDVVDLTDAETQPGARHARFDARVFTAAERGAIAASDRPERVRWCLWAAKEAAFKAARKADAATVFSPCRFEVDLGEGVVRFGGARFAIAVEEADEYVHVVAAGSACTSASFAIAETGALRYAARRRRLLRAVGSLVIAETHSPTTLSRPRFSRGRIEGGPPGRPPSPGDGGASRIAPGATRPSSSSHAVRELATDALAEALEIDARELTIVRHARIPHVKRRGEALPVDLSLSHHGRFVACAFRLVEVA